MADVEIAPCWPFFKIPVPSGGSLGAFGAEFEHRRTVPWALRKENEQETRGRA